MTGNWQPHRESFGVTLRRTLIIAAVAGAVLARLPSSRIPWPVATILAFWISFGGHWVELWFLNWLRPRLSPTRPVQVAARLVVWFVGGTLLVSGLLLTAMALVGFRPSNWPVYWFWGFIFIGIELLVHLIAQLRGRPGFYNGRG